MQQDHEGSESGLRRAAAGVENLRSTKSVHKVELPAGAQHSGS